MSASRVVEHVGGCNSKCREGRHFLSAQQCAAHVRVASDYSEHTGDCGGTRCPVCDCCIHCSGAIDACACPDPACGCGETS